MCNRDGCELSGDHIHLRRCDEIATANVLLEEWARKQGRRLLRERAQAREQERLQESQTARE